MTLEQQAAEDRIVRLCEEAIGGSRPFLICLTALRCIDLDRVPWVPLARRLSAHRIGLVRVEITDNIEAYRTA